MPGPRAPRGDPGISKNVRMLPGLPVSSPKYRWYMSGASKLTVFLTRRRPITRTQKSTVPGASAVIVVTWWTPSRPIAVSSRC